MLSATLVERSAPRANVAAVGETLLLVALWIVVGGADPPGINEAHYLAKARHYWDPSWCARDLFLQSADAHAVFFATFGSLTTIGSLPMAAIIGRWIGWGLLAVGWRALSRAMIDRPLVSLLSGAWFAVLLEHGNLSGEWVIGGIEAKVPAYAFVFLGLAALAAGRWRSVWIWFGLATLFHVLVGAWGMLAAGVAWCRCRPDRMPLRAMAPWVFLGVAIAAPSLGIGIRLQGAADAATVNLADRILVYRRLGHHLAFHQFSHVAMLRFGLLAAAALAFGSRAARSDARWFRIDGFARGACLFAFCGVLIDQGLRNHWGTAAALLKFYWFRLADVAVPIGLALLIARWASRNGRISPDRTRAPTGPRADARLIAAILVPAIVLGNTVRARHGDRRPEAERLWDRTVADPDRARSKGEAWRSACRWIRENTPSDALFLTPRDQQTFKWYAERAEVVTWKDVPQDAPHVIEWRRRWKEIFAWPASRDGVTAWTDEELQEKMRLYGATYLILERPRALRALGPPFRQLYPNSTDDNPDFAVFTLDDILIRS
ncbi:MAG: hypothetical protein FJ297_05830 [Planctomycetes bacterium]|nr:hypothetical protein [Planctomycetota bacterium]